MQVRSTTQDPPSISDTLVENNMYHRDSDCGLPAFTREYVSPEIMVSALEQRDAVTFADRKSIRVIPLLPYPQIDVSVAVTVAPAFPSANATD